MRSFLRLFSFYGRSKRSAYWLYFLISIVAGMVLFPIFELLAVKLDYGGIVETMQKTSPTIVPIFDKIRSVPLTIFVVASSIGALILAGLYVAWLAISVRRLHDMGATGWLVLIFVVLSAIGMYLGYFIASLILGIWPSSRNNRYGSTLGGGREIVGVFDEGQRSFY